jgi:DNA polymerase-3 subunit delta
MGESYRLGQRLLYILFGQDSFSLNESLEEIKKSMGDQALLATNTTVLDGQQISLDQLRTVCETSPFLAGRRLVIVRGLLGRFEAKAGLKKKIGKSLERENNYKSFGDYIGQIPDATVLVLMDGKLKGGNPLFKGISARAEVRAFPLLKATKLGQWIRKRIAGEGSSISPQAVALLAKLVGGDLWVMANEISKLVLFTSGRPIEEEDVKAVVSYGQEANIFDMVDAVVEFKAGAAEQSLHQLLAGGVAPAYLLVVLSRQMERIVRVKELVSQGKSGVEIQDRLGLISEFAWRKTLEQASRYSLERLKKVYHQLLQADLSVKTGEYGGELALNILIAELCRRA